MLEKVLQNNYLKILIILIFILYSRNIAPEIKQYKIFRNPVLHLVLSSSILYYLNNDFVYSMIYALSLLIIIELSKKFLNEKFSSSYGAFDSDDDDADDDTDDDDERNEYRTKIKEVKVTVRKTNVDNIKSLINNIGNDPEQQAENEKLVKVAEQIKTAGDDLNDAVNKASAAVKEAKLSSKNIEDTTNQKKASEAVENAKTSAIIAKAAAEKAKAAAEKAEELYNQVKLNNNSKIQQDNKTNIALATNETIIASSTNKTPILNDAFMIMDYTTNTLEKLLDILAKPVVNYLDL